MTNAEINYSPVFMHSMHKYMTIFQTIYSQGVIYIMYNTWQMLRLFTFWALFTQCIIDDRRSGN